MTVALCNIHMELAHDAVKRLFTFGVICERMSMQYEVTIRLLVKTPNDEDRVARQVEALFECGMVSESFAEGLKLCKNPHFLGVAVSATSPARRSVR